MTRVVAFPTNHPSRRSSLAAYLREIADTIEKDEATCDPHAVVLCLTGPLQHEVVAFGYHTDHQGWRGALAALNAVITARFNTVGGNVRSRDAMLYGPYSAEKPVNIAERLRTRGDA